MVKSPIFQEYVIFYDFNVYVFFIKNAISMNHFHFHHLIESLKLKLDFLNDQNNLLLSRISRNNMEDFKYIYYIKLLLVDLYIASIDIRNIREYKSRYIKNKLAHNLLYIPKI